MKITVCFFTIFICLMPPLFLSGQVHYIIQELPLTENKIKDEIRNLSYEEKINLLSLLPDGEKLEFEYAWSEEEEKEYFPLDTSGLFFIDLNFDDKLDLIYSSQSGNMGIMSSKIYINKGNKFFYHSLLSGDLLHIEKINNRYTCYFVWYPCCDSYTTRISKYSFSKEKTAKKEYIISVIGLKHLKGLPNFEGNNKEKFKNPSLYAKPEDFRLTYPYFRERNKNVRDSIRAGYNIKLIELEGDVDCNILKTIQLNDETWHLVITEILHNLPKSLYEWAKGDNQRLIGWIKQE